MKNINGEADLHQLASEGRIEAMVCLLACGVEINAKSESGDTPLHLAAEKL